MTWPQDRKGCRKSERFRQTHRHEDPHVGVKSGSPKRCGSGSGFHSHRNMKAGSSEKKGFKKRR